MKNSNDTTWNRTSDLNHCGTAVHCDTQQLLNVTTQITICAEDGGSIFRRMLVHIYHNTSCQPRIPKCGLKVEADFPLNTSNHLPELAGAQCRKLQNVLKMEPMCCIKSW